MIAPLLMSALISAPALAQDGVAPPIVNGETTSDYEAVGMLLYCSGSGCATFCSGTLIHEDWVLSAAHCVEAASDMERSGYDIYFATGRSASNVTDYDVAVDLIEHPDYNSSSLQYDIGLIELDSGISGVDPMPLNEQSPSNAWNGKELTYVGYGITSDYANDSGTKRTADIDFWQYDDQFIYGLDTTDDQNLCSGDSGGAALEEQSDGSFELAGVNSFVFAYQYNNYACEGGGSGATRVDQNVEWIEEYVDLGSTSGDDGGDDGSGDDGGDDGGSGSGGSGSGSGSGSGGGSGDGGAGDGSGNWGGTNPTPVDPDDDDDDIEVSSCSTLPVTPGIVLSLMALGATFRRREDR